MRVFFVIGIIFGLLAAASAFAIIWQEYERHQFTRKRLFKEAFQAAIFTFAVFLLLSLLAGFLLVRIVIK